MSSWQQEHHSNHHMLFSTMLSVAVLTNVARTLMPSWSRCGITVCEAGLSFKTSSGFACDIANSGTASLLQAMSINLIKRHPVSNAAIMTMTLHFCMNCCFFWCHMDEHGLSSGIVCVAYRHRPRFSGGLSNSAAADTDSGHAAAAVEHWCGQDNESYDQEQHT